MRTSPVNTASPPEGSRGPFPGPRLLVLSCIALLSISGAEIEAGPQAVIPSIRLKPGPDGDMTLGTFEVAGLEKRAVRELAAKGLTEDQWKAILSIFVDEGPVLAETSTRPAMVGSYRVADDVLHFSPRYPLEPTLRYRARFDLGRVPGVDGRDGVITAHFTLPRKTTRATSIRRIDPTVPVLPANQLRFYVHFDGPMSRGDVYSHIHLLDAAGKPVESPFLEVGEELWNAAGTRLTLLFDPGRIKRGLRPHDEEGPILEPGRSYTLLIDAEWPDANGNPLKEPARKPFRVRPPDDVPIDPRTWRIDRPAAGTRKALEIRFHEPLDRAQLDHVLSVTDAAGRLIAGTATVADDAGSWSFVPEHPWARGGYKVLVETTLEDLAGNQVGRPFEVDVARPITEGAARAETVALPFEVGP